MAWLIRCSSSSFVPCARRMPMWMSTAEGAVLGNILWPDPVSDLISYVFKSRPWTDRVVAISHNAKTFDLHFVLNRLVLMKLLPKLLIMNGQKIMCLMVKNGTWQGNLDNLTLPLRKLQEHSVSQPTNCGTPTSSTQWRILSICVPCPTSRTT